MAQRATSEELLARKEAELEALRLKIKKANEEAKERDREAKTNRLAKLRVRAERQKVIVNQAEDNLGKTEAMIASLEQELGVEPDSE